MTDNLPNVGLAYSLSSGSIGGLSEGGVPVGNVALGSQSATYWASGTTEGLLLADPCAVSACNSNAVAIGDDGQVAGMLRSGPGNNALRAVRWSGVVHDVTEQRQLERQLVHQALV